MLLAAEQSFDRIINKLGLNNFNPSAASLFAAEMVEKAGKPGGCALQASGIEAVSLPATVNSKVFVIDAGGTGTEVSLREVGKSSDDIRWSKILVEDNKDLDSGHDPHSYRRFVAGLLGKIRQANGADTEASISFIWSNGMKAVAAPQGVNGISAVVDGRQITYRKGEPFVRDLKDGDDLGAMLCEEAQKQGLRIRNLLIANDTIFTANSHSGSDAGIICSTGANGTLIQVEGSRRLLFNAESGGTFNFANGAHNSWLTKAEVDFIARGGKQFCLEDLCAGMGIGRMFSINAVHCAQQLGIKHAFAPVRELVRLAGVDQAFDGEAVTKLAKRDFNGFRKLKSAYQTFSALTLNKLEELAVAIEKRAGKAAAVLAYMSVANQVTFAPKSFTFAVDSRIADHSAIFRKAFADTLGTILAGNTVNIVFKQSENNISVPTLGAAISMDALLQA